MAAPVRTKEILGTAGDMGELRAMLADKRCSYVACPELGITALGSEDLCCDHFVLRCYEFLEQVDAERAKGIGGITDRANLKGAVDSCLHGALEVSMKVTSLNNLQKARLLDIMLWAGEHSNRTYSGRGAGEGSRNRYERPQLRTRTGLLPQ